jgi:hypothetical protein
LSLQLNKMLLNGFYSPNLSSITSEQRIRDFNSTTRQAQDWGPLGRISTGASVMNFTSGTRKCFGFRQYGGAVRGGFDHVTSGYFCMARQAAFGSDEMAALINGIIVRDSI